MIRPLRALVPGVLFSLAACVNTPSGYRAAPVFDETSLFKADPAALVFAEQSNVRAEGMTVEWKVALADGGVLSEGRAEMTRVADGREVGFDLPPARAGQAWSIWVLDAAGREALWKLQQRVRDAQADGRTGTFAFRWNKRGGSAADASRVVYMTHAVRLSEGGTWFTVFDNMAMPYDNTDGSSD